MVTSGFEKGKYLSFKEDMLTYHVFKAKWRNEVQPERQVEVRELANLRDSIPQAAHNKIVDCKTLVDAWQILDLEYGKESEIGVQLNLKIASIKLKANSSLHKELDLFNEVKFLSVKIKAAGGVNALKHDEEYIALLLCHLTTDQKLEWYRKEDRDWKKFYLS